MGKMDAKINEIDSKLRQKQFIYDGINFSELLITEWHLKSKYKIGHRLKRLLFGLYGLTKYKLIENGITRKNKSLSTKNKKYLFVQMFHVHDKRHFLVLDTLVRKISKYIPKEDILIISEHKDVKDHYDEHGIDTISMSRIEYSDKKIDISLNKINIFEKYLLKRGVHIYENAKKILNDSSIELVLTTQDFHYFDQIFAKAAKTSGITSITHQHGLVGNPHPGLFKYVFSDYIGIWGETTYSVLKDYVSYEKLLIFGTEKFNDLWTSRKVTNRKAITIGINPIEEEDNFRLLDKILPIIDKIVLNEKSVEKIIIKLHPSLNENRWNKLIEKIIKKNRIQTSCKTNKKNNKEVLESTSILIAMKSTISIEAMIAGCNVIELVTSDPSSKKGVYLPLSQELLIEYDKLGDEIFKIITDSEYRDLMITKQNIILEKIIKYNTLDYEVETILGEKLNRRVIQDLENINEN